MRLFGHQDKSVETGFIFQVIVPVFGDQPANGKEAEIKGYGLSVSLHDLKADDLYRAIRLLDTIKLMRMRSICTTVVIQKYQWTESNFFSVPQFRPLCHKKQFK